jgi:hypothetical protein
MRDASGRRASSALPAVCAPAAAASVAVQHADFEKHRDVVLADPHQPAGGPLISLKTRRDRSPQSSRAEFGSRNKWITKVGAPRQRASIRGTSSL